MLGLALLVCCALPGLAHARGPARDELSLGWSPRVVLRRDQIGSPRLQAGPAWAAGVLRYTRTRALDGHRTGLDFAKATLRSQPDFEYLRWPEQETVKTEGSPQTTVRFDYAYLRALPMPAGLALRLGPALDFDIQQVDWVHHPFALGVYMGVFALDARAELEYSPGPRHRLQMAVSMPLFAWVARSPYALNDDESIYANRDHSGVKTFFRYLAGGRFETWNKLQAARLDLRYDLRLADHWALSTGVHARILANQVPRPMLAQEYGGSIAVSLIF